MHFRWGKSPLTGFMWLVSGCLLAPIGIDTALGAAPTMDDARQMTVHGIYAEPVTLVDGRYEGAPFVAGGASRPVVILLERVSVLDDLDGDGSEELVVLLSESSGGSGTRLYLAAAAAQGKAIENVATHAIGDRVQLRSMTASDGTVTLDLVTAGPDDPACCPAEKTTVAYSLVDGALTETRREALGTLSSDDLDSSQWRLTHLNRQDAAPETTPITAHFQGGQLTGSAGCNQYGAAFQAKTPYDVTIGPIRSTRMACAPKVMDIEGRFIGALGTVRQFGFMLGDLMLTYTADGGVETLRFTAMSPE